MDSTAPAHVQLRIDQLVLEGFPPEHRHRIAGALERELGRLLQRDGVPPAWLAGGAVPALDAGAFAAAPDASPGVIGAQVARAIYGGLSK